MIPFINAQLNNWVHWCMSDRALIRCALGVRNCWPRILGAGASTENEPQHGSFIPLNDLECCEINKAVRALPPDLHAAVIEYYTRIGTKETAAKALGVSVATLFRLIDRAHLHILGTLNDLAAGIQPATAPTLSQKNACTD